MPDVAAGCDVDWDILLHEAIQGRGLTLVYQPIVDLQAVRVAGYEVLARFEGVPGVGPDRWFAAARERHLTPALDAAVVARALARWRTMPGDCILTVNVEPDSIASTELDDAIGRSNRLDGLVLEVTEHVPAADDGGMLRALDRYRALGAAVAVDDAGAGYAGLQHILQLRPTFLKLDRALVQDVDRDETRRALVEMLGVFANRLDAWLVAEGVERPEEAAALRSLGVPLAQGYYFARPAPPWADLDPDAAGLLRRHPGPDGHGHVGALVNPTPWIGLEEVATAGAVLERLGLDVVVVVDDNRRAVGVVDSSAALVGTMEPLFRANVRTGVAELAGRLATQAELPAVVACHDDTGRYVGTVTLRRVLGALAADR